MAKSTFGMDLWKEQVLGEFLNSIYKKIGFKFERISDKKLQREGVDLYLSLKNHENMIVDEKAQLSYIDKTLNTFAFELGYYLNGKYKKGWLFDEDKKTQYYLLICNIKTQKNNGYLKDNNITSCELILIQRQKLIYFLENRGINSESSQVKQSEYRNQNLNGRILIEGEENMYYFLTQKLAEKPFNIVIKKKELIKLALYSKKINLIKK